MRRSVGYLDLVSTEWSRFIARLVEDERGNQRRTARKIGIPSQMVGRWLLGAEPKPEMVRKVAKVTKHSLPYLMSVAYGIPLEEMADGVGGDVLPYDTSIVNRGARGHIASQYGWLVHIPADVQFPPLTQPPDEPDQEQP